MECCVRFNVLGDLVQLWEDVSSRFLKESLFGEDVELMPVQQSANQS